MSKVSKLSITVSKGVKTVNNGAKHARLPDGYDSFDTNLRLNTVLTRFDGKGSQTR